MTPYIVCTGATGRCVIYGYADHEPVPGEPIRLERAKMVLYWSAACRGLLGLAQHGPQEGTRLTPAVAATGAETVREWVAVSPEAAEGMDSWD